MMSYSPSSSGIHTVGRLRLPMSSVEREFTGVQHSGRQATFFQTPATMLIFG